MVTLPRWAGLCRSTSIPLRSSALPGPDFRAPNCFSRPICGPHRQFVRKSATYFSFEERGNHNAWAVGHLKAGVTPAAATSDLNTIANSLAKTYPKSDDGLKFSLSRPGLAGNTLGRPTRAFMFGLMLLAGLILLAACANLVACSPRGRRIARAKSRSAWLSDRAASSSFASSSPKPFWFLWREVSVERREPSSFCEPSAPGGRFQYPDQYAGQSGLDHLRSGLPARSLQWALFWPGPVRQILRLIPGR